MKGLSSTLLALIFAVFSLFSLMMAERSLEESLVPLRYGQARATELGFRIVLDRYFDRAPLRHSSTQRDKARAARRENSRREI